MLVCNRGWYRDELVEAYPGLSRRGQKESSAPGLKLYLILFISDKLKAFSRSNISEGVKELGTSIWYSLFVDVTPDSAIMWSNQILFSTMSRIKVKSRITSIAESYWPISPNKSSWNLKIGHYVVQERFVDCNFKITGTAIQKAITFVVLAIPRRWQIWKNIWAWGLV